MNRRLRPALAALLAAAALVGAASPAGAQGAPGIAGQMVCIAPGDADGIDNLLVRADSPLAGEGATFVREARRVGIDPRALVAIAAHETILLTYGPSQLIRNPFGLGPGWSFDTHAEAIARAATTLERYYLPEGRVTLADIGAKWAPLGVANDPTNLNQHWAGGVGTYFRAMGGDPERPILLGDQSPLPDCAPIAIDPATDRPAPPPDPADPAPPPADPGPPVVTAWGGLTPTLAGEGADAGGDPATGSPAVIPGFAFPLALPRGAQADYADTFSLPGAVMCGGDWGRRCAVTITVAAGTPAVAMAAGTLRPATIAEREEGIAFWLVTDGGDRLGYAPLRAYAAGVGDGARVAPGQRLGETAVTLRVAWERAGVRINPYPLLATTRAPIG